MTKVIIAFRNFTNMPKTWNLAMNPVYLVTRAVRLILRVENCATCAGVQSVVDFPTTYVIVITETKRFSSKCLYMLKEMPWRVDKSRMDENQLGVIQLLYAITGFTYRAVSNQSEN
jgi:hypothetical protein